MEYETIYGNIIAKANHYLAVPDKNGTRRIIKDDAIRKYERAFAKQCTIYKNKAICTPFKLYAKIYYTNALCDLDNSIKTLLDCLQDVGAITNDNLCTQIIAEKHLAKRGKVEFAITTPQLNLFDTLI